MRQDNLYRVVLTGGGSGGHIMPLLAVAERLREKLGDRADFLYIGSDGKIEKEAMRTSSIPAKFIWVGKMRRYFSWRNVADCFKIPCGFLQSLWHLWRYMPDVIFSKGGYVSVPVVLAAWVYRIPILTQDSDAVPGMATRMLGKFANRVAVAYPSAMRYFPASSVALVGNPVRSGVLGGKLADAFARFGLDKEKPTVLVLGGSLGARVIDKAVVAVLPRLLPEAQVIHQTGDALYDETVNQALELGIAIDAQGYHPRSFLSLEELRDALCAADVIISRAGANAIAEIAAAGKPAILIPLVSAANDEQRMNAYEIARVGGALVLEEGNLGENIFLGKILGILSDADLRKRMTEAVFAFYHPEAADAIADELLRLTRKE